jgi:membrane protein DedA with SNARE-associated domain
MDYLPDTETLSLWLLNYGSFALFGLLALGIIALPVPEETLMVIAGVLIAKGKIEAIPTIMAAYMGSMCGISVSYLLGRTAGRHIIESYGPWFGLTQAKLKSVHEWFESFGKWTLFFGYFIPGVRHFTGFCAGTSYLEYHLFALFAYTGGIFWASTFLSAGYFLGDYWHTAYEYVNGVADKIVLGLFLIGIGYLIYRFYYKPSSGKSG